MEKDILTQTDDIEEEMEEIDKEDSVFIEVNEDTAYENHWFS